METEIGMNKNWKKFFIGLSFFLVSVLAIFIARDYISLTPWEGSRALDNPSFVLQSSDGSILAIEQSLRRVSKISPSGELEFKIQGGNKESNSFWFADEIATNEANHIFVLARKMDDPGFYCIQTSVIEYDENGNFLRTLFSKDYTKEELGPTLVQKGRAFGLKAFKDKIAWFEPSPQKLLFRKLELTTQKLTESVITTGENIDLLVSSADSDETGRIVWVEKTGLVKLSTDQNNVETLYDAKNFPTDFTQPWKVRIGKEFIYFSDLGKQGIYTIDAQKNIQELIGPGNSKELNLQGDLLFYGLSINSKNELGSIDSGGAYIFGDHKQVKYIDAPQFKITKVIISWALWLAAIIGIIGIIILGHFVYRDVLKGTIPKLLKTIFSIIILTVLVGTVVANIILNNFQKRYQDEVLNKISQMTNLVPDYLDVDKLMSIKTTDQFLSSDYMFIREQIIRAVYGREKDRNNGFYFAVHRIKDDGKLYTFMYLNGEPSIWHPFGWLNDETTSYASSIKGTSNASITTDSWGNWMLATAPIRDSAGKIIGVFEMGGDFYAFTQENKKLLEDLIWNIATVLVLILIGIVEFIFLSDLLSKKKQAELLAQRGIKSQRSSDTFHQAFMTRPVMGIFFFATSMSLLFLPLVAGEFLKLPDNKTWLDLADKNLLIALPLSARLLFFGLGTILSGFLVGRIRYRAVFITGLILCGAGLLFSGISTDFTIFLIASAALGLGTGISTIAMRSIINAEQDENVRIEGYSHYYSGLIAGTNIGVMVGNWLSDAFLQGKDLLQSISRYQNVFLISLGALVLVLWAMFSLLPKSKHVLHPHHDNSTKFAMAKFIFNPQIMAFFILAIIPIYFISMVLGFVLPVFGESQNLSNADQARIFLANGILIIYLGPLMAKLAQRIKGTAATLHISTILWILSLAPFIISPNILGMILTVAIMGLAEALAVPAQNNFFLNLKASKQIGSDRASGIFEVFGKIGETIAPILLGLALIIGYQVGLAIVAISVIGLYIIFMLITALGRKKEGSHE